MAVTEFKCGVWTSRKSDTEAYSLFFSFSSSGQLSFPL